MRLQCTVLRYFNDKLSHSNLPTYFEINKWLENSGFSSNSLFLSWWFLHCVQCAYEIGEKTQSNDFYAHYYYVLLLLLLLLISIRSSILYFLIVRRPTNKRINKKSFEKQQDERETTKWWNQMKKIIK